MGRSRDPRGPYLDKNGNDMKDGHGSVFLCDFGSKCIGPGHIGIMPYENDTFLFTFHYYDKDDSGISKLGYNVSKWKRDEWPALTDEHTIAAHSNNINEINVVNEVKQNVTNNDTNEVKQNVTDNDDDDDEMDTMSKVKMVLLILSIILLIIMVCISIIYIVKMNKK